MIARNGSSQRRSNSSRCVGFLLSLQFANEDEDRGGRSGESECQLGGWAVAAPSASVCVAKVEGLGEPEKSTTRLNNIVGRRRIAGTLCGKCAPVKSEF